MQAEIIAIGSELTSGAKLDTNSQWLSLELAELGIAVHYHTTMADSLGAMIETMRIAVDRSDLVFVTGGLGPTLDDITRDAIAGLAGVELVLNEESLEHIRELFAKRQREMPTRNEIQAMFPAGSRPISNPRGSAPGIWMELSREGRTCQLIAMPGVPSEMKRMYQHEVRPHLPVSDRVMRRARVNCFGVGESTAEEMLGELTGRNQEPEVGITVHEATITLRINAEGATEDECLVKIKTARDEIQARLGPLVFGEEDQQLQDVVIAGLIGRGRTLACAENGTGGVLAAMLSDVTGSDECFRGGRVLPNGAALQTELGLGADLGGNSQQVAERMAEVCRELYETDYALAVTECPVYDPDDAEAEPPTTWVAVASAERTQARSLTLLGDVSFTRIRSVKMALDLLRHQLG